MAVSLALTIAVAAVPFLRTAFGFAALSAAQFLTAAALALSIIPIIECIKCIRRRMSKN